MARKQAEAERKKELVSSTSHTIIIIDVWLGITDVLHIHVYILLVIYLFSNVNVRRISDVVRRNNVARMRR